MISLFELGLAIFIGIFSIFITKVILTYFYKRKTGESFPYKNLAFMIFLSSSIFGVAWLMFGIIDPLNSTLKLLHSGNETYSKIAFEYMKYLGLFMVIGYTLGAAINYVSYLIFSKLTKNVDEFEEIANENIGVAIMVSVVIIVMSLFCRVPFIYLLESLIPYPDLVGFF